MHGQLHGDIHMKYISHRQIRVSFLVILTCFMATACSESEQDVMQSYLKHMTEVAVIIESTRSQESAITAARRIAELSSQINPLVNRIRSLPETTQDELMRTHGTSIREINQRISSALSELALRDAGARRTISDELVRLERL
ncbi:MAG: hypothetical protein Tsb0027_07630 [Wenzhouxiangellaceae bacterium]